MSEAVQEDLKPQYEPLAWISIISSVIGLVLCILIFPALIAVVCGHLAKRRIKLSEGKLKGNSLANQGLLLGYLALIVSPIGHALLLPALTHSHVQADRTKELNQLKMIGMSLFIYQDEHDEQYPPDLATLLELKMNPKEHFISPHTGNSPTSKAREMRAGKGCDFVYRRPETNRPPENTVMVHSKATNFGDWQGVLFADGHVENVYAPENVATAAQVQGWILPPVTP